MGTDGSGGKPAVPGIGVPATVSIIGVSLEARKD